MKNHVFLIFFVYHELHSKIQVSILKYVEYNTILTLQYLNTWLIFNKKITHREASIGFLKYISIGLIFLYWQKRE